MLPCPSKMDVLAEIEVGQYVDAYSNCSAAIRLVNPSTITTISQGRNFSLAVLWAPPFATPLCCASRLGGFGVEPIYSDACRTVDRRR